VAEALSRDDETLLNAMKALEFGVVDTERRSPFKAMVMSGLLFLGGALSSVLPFLFVEETGVGLAWSAALTAIGLFGVGLVKASVTRSNRALSGLENLVIAGCGGLVAWWVGKLVGAGLS
jgi:VIT1/CCC1 family predicted Fe2+/Mn2+ transporter